MNTVITQLKNRTSVRTFTGESVTAQDLNLILETAQQAPTSINAQQISLIYTQDKQTIRQIAEIAGGQPQVATADVFITIVIDFNRTAQAAQLANKQQVIHQSAEGLIVGAGDAGIMLNALQTAANALGYGSTAIGGIRNDPDAMIKLLGLPKNTYPIFGITLGVTDTSKQALVKPRVPLDSFAMQDKYNTEKVQAGVEAYDKTLRQWWDKQGLTQMRSYAEETAQFYSQVYFPNVAKTLRQQGFELQDEVIAN